MSLKFSLRLHSLFSDGAILQAGSPVPLKGQSQPGQAVKIRLAENACQTMADAQGFWSAELPELPAGGPHLLQVESEGQRVESQVWFGDVWLASGQSNMAWPLEETNDGAEEAAACHDPLLRFFVVTECSASAPVSSPEGSWNPAQDGMAARFSSVAYHFARTLRQTQSRPIGIVQAAIGGTLISCWKSRATLQADPQTEVYWKAYQQATETYPSRFQKWKDGQEQGQRPPPPVRLLPSGYFNGMISPLVGFPLKGVIWYQGEGNNRSADHYEREFTELIAEWRQLWSRPELPFYFVQLAGFDGQPWVNHNWPYLRDAQLNTWRNVPHTGMAVAIDIGDQEKIHPTDKQPVGERLARWARHLADGGQTIASGPLFRSAAKESGQIRVSFDYVAEGLTTSDGAPVTGFQISIEGDNFQPAEARIDGREIIIPFAGQASDFHLRYAWAGLPQANLCNSEALPAVPFRTDHLPFVAE